MAQPTRLERATNTRNEQNGFYSAPERVAADCEYNEAIRESQGYIPQHRVRPLP